MSSVSSLNSTFSQLMSFESYCCYGLGTDCHDHNLGEEDIHQGTLVVEDLATDPMEEGSPSCQEEAYVQHDHPSAWDHGDVPLVVQMEEAFQEMEVACHL